MIKTFVWRVLDMGFPNGKCCCCIYTGQPPGKSPNREVCDHRSLCELLLRNVEILLRSMRHLGMNSQCCERVPCLCTVWMTSIV